MKNTNKRLLCFLFTFLPTLAFSYPVYIRIENPRKHPLYVISSNGLIKMTLPSNTNKEFMLYCENDYKVVYKSGMSGKVTKPNLDEKLTTFIDACKESMGDHWKEKTVKYCVLQLTEKEVAVTGTTYTLKVTGIRDLKIPFLGDARCCFSDNEKAQKLVPAALPLLTVEAKAASALLFGKCD